MEPERKLSPNRGNAGKGRPKGVPNKATASVKELAGKYGPDAIATLAAIMKNDEAPEPARVAACRELLDRAYGKASQILGSDPDNPLPTNLAVLFRDA